MKTEEMLEAIFSNQQNIPHGTGKQMILDCMKAVYNMALDDAASICSVGRLDNTEYVDKDSILRLKINN